MTHPSHFVNYQHEGVQSGWDDFPSRAVEWLVAAPGFFEAFVARFIATAAGKFGAAAGHARGWDESSQPRAMRELRAGPGHQFERTPINSNTNLGAWVFGFMWIGWKSAKPS